jgi:DNA-binding SARP family transcriptional activator
MQQHAHDAWLVSSPTGEQSLVQRGEHCLQLGQLQQAEQLFTQAWERKAHGSLADRDAAAWNMVWLRLHAADHAGAAAWLRRIVNMPAGSAPLWFMQRVVLVDLCQRLAAAGVHEPRQPVPAVSPPQTSALPPLTVFHFGQFRVMRGSMQLPACRSRKAVALFRYLLSRPQRSARREELMDLLWPEALPDKAAHSLHVTVGALRRHLDVPPESYLVFASGEYSLNPAAMIVDDRAAFVQAINDAERFWRASDAQQARESYIRALTYYQGDYYMDDHDTSWAVAERERMLVRYLGALDRLGALFMQQENFDAAAECFQLLLERDEYREDVHCQLMECYVRLGRRNDAVRQYRHCVQVLATELGLDPMPETQIAFQQMLAR